jgi:hypothetical protein
MNNSAHVVSIQKTTTQFHKYNGNVNKEQYKESKKAALKATQCL